MLTNMLFSYEDAEHEWFGRPVLSAARQTRTGIDCLAQAIIMTMESKYRIHWAKELGLRFDYTLSVQHLHDMCAEQGIIGSEHALNLLKVKGVTTECYYPGKVDTSYVPLRTSPTFRIKGWDLMDPCNICSIIKHIPTAGPFISVIPMHRNYDTCESGIYIPRGWKCITETGSPIYHAVVLVGYGYCDNQLAFRCIDFNGPHLGRRGIRWIHRKAIVHVINITVGGADTISNVKFS